MNKKTLNALKLPKKEKECDVKWEGLIGITFGNFLI